MLPELIDEFYNKLAINFYRNAIEHQKFEGVSTLSSTDMSTLEIVYLLNRPTYSEVTDFLKISTSNANYRINKLITKGYLKREQDPTDKRRYFLNVTEKFMDYYCVNDSLLEQVVKNVRNRVRKEDLEQFESTLAIIIEEMSD